MHHDRRVTLSAIACSVDNAYTNVYIQTYLHYLQTMSLFVLLGFE